MKKLILTLVAAVTLAASAHAGLFSSDKPKQDYSNQGASPAKARKMLDVKLNSRGLTLEQQNIIDSYQIENKPGAIKHLYLISPFSGKVMFYSTVRGKVTDNAKGLTPSNAVSNSTPGGGSNNRHYILSSYKGKQFYTNQVPNPSGTYGTSKMAYIYWTDVKGQYYKKFKGMAEMIISDKPIPMRDGSLIIQMK